jgi:hypothetical protein
MQTYPGREHLTWEPNGGYNAGYVFWRGIPVEHYNDCVERKCRATPYL